MQSLQTFVLVVVSDQRYVQDLPRLLRIYCPCYARTVLCYTFCDKFPDNVLSLVSDQNLGSALDRIFVLLLSRLRPDLVSDNKILQPLPGFLCNYFRKYTPEFGIFNICTLDPHQKQEMIRFLFIQTLVSNQIASGDLLHPKFLIKMDKVALDQLSKSSLSTILGPLKNTNNFKLETTRFENSASSRRIYLMESELEIEKTNLNSTRIQ